MLTSINDDYNTSYNITSELIDSLIFNEMYKFLFEECLVKFYSEEEKKIRKVLKDTPSKYDWDSMKVNDVYYKCKFENAIKLLKDIGCSLNSIKNILSCNPFYLTRGLNSIKKLLNKFYELGFSYLYILFDSNPYILNKSDTDLEELYNQKISEGLTKNEVLDFIQYNMFF